MWMGEATIETGGTCHLLVFGIAFIILVFSQICKVIARSHFCSQALNAPDYEPHHTLSERNRKERKTLELKEKDLVFPQKTPPLIYTETESRIASY